MSRVEEIASAMRAHPEPMFLFGLVSLAHHDYEEITQDMFAADKLVWAEQQAQLKKESA